MKITFLDTETFGDAFHQKEFESLGQVECFAFTKPNETTARIQNSTVIVTNKVRITPEHIDQCTGLKLICIAATGTDNVAVDYARQKGVIVKNAVGYSTESVAEITLTLALALKNQVKYYDKFVQDEYVNNNTFTHIGPGFSTIRKQKVGIIGLGNIGKQVAQLFQSFGAEIGYYSISQKEQEVDYTFYKDFSEFLAQQDIVSIHCPLTPVSKGLINAESLQKMKKTAFLINIARGPVVKEADVVQAIKEGTIAGMASDVFEKEPIEKGSPFQEIASFPNVILTPHIAWASVEARKKLLEIIKSHIENEVHSY